MSQFRQVQPGFERVPAGFARRRHAHFYAYVSIILDGGYEQASYAGRVRLAPGDVLVQPMLDRHENLPVGARGTHLLRLGWHFDASLGGVYRVRAIDDVIRTAARDPAAASGLLRELLEHATPLQPRSADWPDLLAQDLRGGEVGIADWAQRNGLARESVARGFRRSYGTSPRSFATELRAREAWLRVVTDSSGLAHIAAELGYADQAHMTRAIRALTGAPPHRWRRDLSVYARAAR